MHCPLIPVEIILPLHVPKGRSSCFILCCF
jgi:hypothetical protein